MENDISICFCQGGGFKSGAPAGLFVFSTGFLLLSKNMHTRLVHDIYSHIIAKRTKDIFGSKPTVTL